jgi:cell division protein FtsN
MRFQRGGFVMGMIVGLMVGLAIALGVALYVTKVPVPFVNKVPQRTAEQDAAEQERNRNWDPNSPLYGRNPARPGQMPRPPGGTATGVVTPAPAASEPREAPWPPESGISNETPPASRRDPADILADRPADRAATAPASAPTAAATPAAREGADPFSYFVQVGAFGRVEDAEQQRARLAMLGFGARVTEREQGGRTVYRVRVGPFDRKEEADSARERLNGSGMESSLVRVQR